jgi:glycosyltransferase involved in cell wall biosynthesis
MKICIISQPANWTTGFGITCCKIATGLSKNGHKVYCAGFAFGIVSSEETVQPNYNFTIWNGNKEKSEFEAVGNFIREVEPDVIILNFDIAAVVYFLNLLKLNNVKQKIFAHTVLDGFPASEEFIDALAKIEGVIVPTQATKKYLKSTGLKNVHYAPHGVDTDEFFPMDKDVIRKKINLNIKKDFIIGVFGKNDERKQIPRVLLALHHLIYNLKQKNIYLYIHSETQRIVGTGWDLEFIAGYLKLKNHIIFTEKSFKPQIGIEQGGSAAQQGIANKTLTYLERINMCDVIVNVPFSGGFELCTVEAQACGIPLITINDSGNIQEVAGDAALLVEPKVKNIWINGAFIHYVDEIDVAEKILLLRNNGALHQSLKEKGLNNIKRYTWRHLEKTIEKVITADYKNAVLQPDLN